MFFFFIFFSFFFFFLLFYLHSSLLQYLVSWVILKKTKIKQFWYFLLISFYIKKLYHPTEGYSFSFWPCCMRYCLLIIDKSPAEFSLLMQAFHFSLENTYRFIHPRISFLILLRILGSSLLLLLLFFSGVIYLKLL